MYSSKKNFDQWYRDVPGMNTKLYANALFSRRSSPPNIGSDPQVAADWGAVNVWDEWYVLLHQIT